MAVQIGARLDAGFDDPLGMLKDCHRRIESFLRVLCHVAEREQEGPLSPEERNAVQAALEYFRVGGQRHTQDEEESLFPRMHKAGAADGLEALAELEQQHCEANQLHAAADRLFSKWLESGSLPAADRASLRTTAARLADLYAEHIRVEEQVVFPHAGECLDAEALASMGAEFRARRSAPARVSR
jgi:hemerythrin-like domain-containing protein